MDPLSISVAVLTILGSGGSLASALRQVTSKNAPDALLALNNEVSDLHLIVLEISQLFQEHHESTSAHLRTDRLLTSLGLMLGRAKEKLLELESLVQYKLTTPDGPSGEAKLNRLAWVREQKTVLDIREDIRSTRLSLGALVGILAAKATLRVEFQVAELRFISDQFHDQQGVAQAVSRQENTERAMSEIIAGQARMERNLNGLSATFTARQLFPVSMSTTRNTANQERAYTGSWGLQILSVRQRCNGTCTPDCTCCCHQRSTWRSPPVLKDFLGLLFVGYTGLPLLSPKCDKQTCPQKSGPVIHIKYYFPGWFMTRALEMIAYISRPDGLNQSLRVSQIVWIDAKIFRLCRAGDVKGLKSLLALREGSPTPHDTAWTAILGTTVSSAIVDALQSMFPNPNVEKYQFKSTHKAVLGLNSVGLADVLRQCPFLIDAVDIDDRTALSWSSQRGDLRALELLLHHGANVHKADRFGNTPLSYAVQSGSRLCVQLLLDHGANVNTTNTQCVGPLHRLAGKSDDVGLLDCLLSHQVDINALMKGDGVSSLIYAIVKNNNRVAMRLIELGANLHIKTVDGTTALSYAVENNSHSALTLLLQCGADHIGEIYEYGSFLHLVAENADLESLRLLTNAHLATRDIYHKRSDGLTALDVARKRAGRDLQLFNAFMEFVGSVDPVAISAGLHNGSDVEEDEFEDAVERQD
ncbi:MAG: hypothetical protein Q9187_007273 [Circinaria calcarea]